jgi:hypothetical protein
MEKVFNLGNGHAIKVENANRGTEDDYKIIFFEDGRKLDEEYGTREYIEYNYGVNLND